MLRCILALLSAAIMPLTGAFASEIPDLKGTWVVEVEGVKIQKNMGFAPQNVDLVAPKTGKFETEITVTFEIQDEFAVFGTKASARASEPISGIVDYDNIRVFLVDDDGMTSCSVVSQGQMNCFYIEVNAVDSIAARQIWTRQE